MPLHCRHCSSEIDLKFSLKKSPYSWPNMQSFWYQCAECNKGNHIRIDEGLASVIEVIGAPGPEWKRIERERIEKLSFRSDPSVLHVWIEDDYFDIPSRK